MHDKFSLNVQNKGVGPAKVKWVIVRVDGKAVQSWQEMREIILGEVHGNTNMSFIYTRVVAPQEFIRMTELHDPKDIAVAAENRRRISLEICYASISDDHWIVRRDTTGIHRYPTKYYDIPDSLKFYN